MKFQVGNVLGAYRIMEFLGKGSMGEEYIVQHVKLHIQRVLKVFAPATEDAEKRQILRNRFGVEARVLCELAEGKPDDVRLAKVYEYNDSDPLAPYYVMDYVRCADGKSRSLYDAKADGYDFTAEAIVRWFKDVCRALDYMHSKHIVHRDIKPKNILLDQDGHAVLADLGTVKLLDEKDQSRFEQEKSFVDSRYRMQFGTEEFWAPEIFNGKEATPASDCYALAKTFWWLLRDEYVSVEDNLDDWPDEYDVRWKRILPKMLEPCPEKRLVDLDKCLSVFSSRRRGNRREKKVTDSGKGMVLEHSSDCRNVAPLRPFWMWSIVILIPFMVFWFRRYRHYSDTWVGRHPWYYLGGMWCVAYLLNLLFPN